MPQQAGTYSSASPTVAESMREARAALVLRAGRIAAVIAVTVHLLYTITDWFLYHDAVLIAIRLLTALGIALLLGLSYTPWGTRHPLSFVSAGFVVTGAGLASFLWHQDIFLTVESYPSVFKYEGAFILIILTFCVLIPTTTVRAALVCTVSLRY
ncbi:MAG: hypothetical protein HYZ72_12430 [Deltaproteobacteria bacterium]|nr:hypothetical protein [Deltaproteobacteria bacterium]